MEEEMVDDTVNEEEVEYNFTAYEIDLDYEFDASRFFDFSRAESPMEARQAELWFDSAGSYPPSPFVARLVPREEILMGNINISPKSKGVESMNLCEGDSDVEVDREISAMGTQYGGLTFYNHMEKNVNSQNQTKLSLKPTCPRTSTLMKPTASQLAKQNRTFHAGYSRPQSSVLDKTSKSSASTSVIENQAAKRQKLEGGLLRKPHSGSLKCSLMRTSEDYNSKQVAGAVQLQQTNFVHKVPQRDGFFDGSMSRAKPRITIPRDPDLETAQRAQRTSSLFVRPSLMNNASRPDGCQSSHSFKALPLNKKIKQPAKLKLPPFGGKQQPSADEGKDELSTASGISWSKSVR
ncbi:UNVERIFIED_CONTAM: hypothetical protein Slati_4308400 [Sesamum latifolium]|uniref:TPX2 central domain-containing protein n=1 Tax=Sesamum latifolium TaxID=2727402 RepID=A0AAW2SLU0_9LAMI